MRGIFVILAIATGSLATETFAQTWQEADKAYKACFAPASPEDTIEGCSKAIDLGANYDPKTFNGVLNNRGVALMKTKQYERAIKNFDLAIRVYPQAAIPYLNRAMVKGRMGQFAETLQDLDHVLAEMPDNAIALNQRCFTRAVLNKDLDRALADCNQSLEKRPRDANAMDSKAFVLFRQGKYQAALDTYDAALKIDPKLAASLLIRGYAKKKLLISGADEDIVAAKSIDPGIEARFLSFGEISN